MGAAPEPDRGRERRLRAQAGRLRPRLRDPRGLPAGDGRGREGRGDARRRDDRRSLPQAGRCDVRTWRSGWNDPLPRLMAVQKLTSRREELRRKVAADRLDAHQFEPHELAWSYARAEPAGPTVD